MCGTSTIIQIFVFLTQTLFLSNELVILYLLKDELWVVNKYIDTGVFVAIHIGNFVYYKIKCKKFSLCVQTTIEVINLILSMGLVFLAVQLSPNVSISLYNNQTDNLKVLSCILSQLLLMISIYGQFAQIVQSVISLISKYYFEKRKKNKTEMKIDQSQVVLIPSLLDELVNQLDVNSEESL